MRYPPAHQAQPHSWLLQQRLRRMPVVRVVRVASRLSKVWVINVPLLDNFQLDPYRSTSAGDDTRNAEARLGGSGWEPPLPRRELTVSNRDCQIWHRHGISRGRGIDFR